MRNRNRLALMTGIIVVLALAIAACDTAHPAEIPGESLNPLGATWSEIHQGVWGGMTTYPDGSYVIGRRIVSLDGFRWIVENEWKPELVAIREELRNELAPGEKGALEFRQQELEFRLARFEVWQSAAYSFVEKSSEKGSELQCSPVAAATAGPTTGGAGAKGHANARSCVSGINSFARASAEAGGVANHDHSENPWGTYVTAYAERFGPNCRSSAWAEGAPLAVAMDYYGC